MSKPGLIRPLNIVLLIAGNFIDNYAHGRLLESMGIGNKFMEFSDPREAIGYLKIVYNLHDKTGKNSIDLIIFDMNAFKANTIAFAKELKTICEKLPAKLLLMSDFFDKTELEQLKLENIAAGFIQKPLDAEKLMEYFKTVPGLEETDTGLR